MSRTLIAACLAVLVGALLVSACSPQAAPTLDANTVYTQAAGTVEAELARAAALTPSATSTTVPTQTTAPTLAPTAAPVTPTVATSPISVATATRPVSPDKAEFVAQSVADDTRMTPGQQFPLTWTVKNVGTSTWTKAYLVRFFSGDQLGAPATVAFPKEVKPGETVELTINMTASTTAGSYRGNWVLTNANGVNFFSIFISIVVGNGPTSTAQVPSATPSTPTIEPTVTPTP